MSRRYAPFRSKAAFLDARAQIAERKLHVPRPCSAIRQGDEVACHCGLRWSLSEDRPECPHGGEY